MTSSEHNKSALLRRLPAVELLRNDPAILERQGEVAPTVVTDAARRAVDSLRQFILAANEPELKQLVETTDTQLTERIVQHALKLIDEACRPHYRRVINASGIVLHTALGRAVLSRAALDQIAGQYAGYSLLQVDTRSGKRSRRDAMIEQLLQKLTGCEAATVVNNNAAATALVLNTVVTDPGGKAPNPDRREVIVSRGQLVEIGGAFRLPDVMAFSGAKMIEIGTTNKTHLRDYENAITENTAAILRVHPSNFKIMGFTSEVPLEPLVELAHRHGLPLIDDVGAGSLIDFSQFGFKPEPTLPESVKAGADLITSSADKLIGGPQGGIIMGRSDLVDRVRKNQFARIVRAGKLTFAALEATLKAFLDEQRALDEIPTLRMLQRTLDELERSANRIADAIRTKIDSSMASIDVIDGFSQMGSGSLPTQDLPSRLVAIVPAASGAEAITLEELALRLRCNEPPVFARLRDERLLIDPRTLLEGDENELIEAVVASLRV